MARAVHSGYVDGRRRAGQVRRLHIIREDGPRPGKQTMCHQAAYKVTDSTPVVIDPMPEQPPDGLTWCPKCVGHLAERLGVLGEIAAYLTRNGVPPDNRDARSGVLPAVSTTGGAEHVPSTP